MSELYAYEFRTRDAVVASCHAATLGEAMADLGYAPDKWLVVYEYLHMAVIQERKVTGEYLVRGHRTLGVTWSRVHGKGGVM